jgi:hypothetical protein
MSVFTWAWIFWLAMFAAVEGVAIFNKKPGDTLSEHIWAWFKIRESRQWNVRRWVLAIFLVWLTVHMVAGF